MQNKCCTLATGGSAKTFIKAPKFAEIAAFILSAMGMIMNCIKMVGNAMPKL